VGSPVAAGEKDRVQGTENEEKMEEGVGSDSSSESIERVNSPT